MNSEYLALIAKVETFGKATSERRKADMACQGGCDSCCHTWLTLSPVEADALGKAAAALPTAQRKALALRGQRELEREARGDAPARCAMLNEHGLCDVYEHRPLVCRTQGHALKYPQGFIPEAAVRARVGQGEMTHCPLNFRERAPEGRDILDAELVDQLLSVVNHRFTQARDGRPSDARKRVSEIAKEAEDQGSVRDKKADMLGCDESFE